MKRIPSSRLCCSSCLNLAVAAGLVIGLSASARAQVAEFQPVKPATATETDVRVLKVPEVVGTHALQQKQPVSPGLIEQIKSVRDPVSRLHSGNSVNMPGHPKTTNGSPHLNR